MYTICKPIFAYGKIRLIKQICIQQYRIEISIRQISFLNSHLIYK